MVALRTSPPASISPSSPSTSALHGTCKGAGSDPAWSGFSVISLAAGRCAGRVLLRLCSRSQHHQRTISFGSSGHVRSVSHRSRYTHCQPVGPGKLTCVQLKGSTASGITSTPPEGRHRTRSRDDGHVLASQGSGSPTSKRCPLLRCSRWRSAENPGTSPTTTAGAPCCYPFSWAGVSFVPCGRGPTTIAHPHKTRCS